MIFSVSGLSSKKSQQLQQKEKGRRKKKTHKKNPKKLAPVSLRSMQLVFIFLGKETGEVHPLYAISPGEKINLANETTQQDSQSWKLRMIRNEIKT